MDSHGYGLVMDTEDGRSNASNSNTNGVNVNQFEYMFGEHMESYSVEVSYLNA